MIDLTLLKELMLKRQTNQKSAIFVTFICYFLNKWFNFQLNVCNRCHDPLMMSMNLSDIAILNIKSDDYCCIISGISKSEAMKLKQSIDLTENSGSL